MNKVDLAVAIAQATGMTKKNSEKAVQVMLNEIAASLKKGEKVSLAGFGTFEVRARAARVGRNPRSGQTIKIAASKVPAFKAGKALKDAL